MTQDEIIRMAREVGLERTVPIMPLGSSYTVIPDYERLERFAALVAADEREACAKRLEAVGCDHCAANIRLRSNND